MSLCHSVCLPVCLCESALHVCTCVCVFTLPFMCVCVCVCHSSSVSVAKSCQATLCPPAHSLSLLVCCASLAVQEPCYHLCSTVIHRKRSVELSKPNNHLENRSFLHAVNDAKGLILT